VISHTLAILLWMVALSGPADGTRIWLDVPFVAQTGNGCGAACVSMVMRYWAHQPTTSAPAGADPGTVMSNLYSTTGGGILASQMKEYFENQGFRTYVFAAEWSDLNHHLARGRPVIVCLKEDALHYVVVVGIDPHNDTVIVNDPARRKLTQIDQPSFEKSWNTCKNWTLLALPPSRE
jgi:predicted double-glycine peptidase